MPKIKRQLYCSCTRFTGPDEFHASSVRHRRHHHRPPLVLRSGAGCGERADMPVSLPHSFADDDYHHLAGSADSREDGRRGKYV